MTGIKDLKNAPARKRVLWAAVLVEVLFLLCYGAAVVFRFSGQEPLAYTADDMQLLYENGETEAGNYTDLSYSDIKAVVTPAFRLRDGL